MERLISIKSRYIQIYAFMKKVMLLYKNTIEEYDKILPMDLNNDMRQRLSLVQVEMDSMNCNIEEMKQKVYEQTKRMNVFIGLHGSSLGKHNLLTANSVTPVTEALQHAVHAVQSTKDIEHVPKD